MMQRVNGTFVLPENFTFTNHTEEKPVDPHEHVVNVAVLSCVGLCVFATIASSFFLLLCNYELVIARGLWWCWLLSVCWADLFIAGFCTVHVFDITLNSSHMYKHLVNYTRPSQQRYIVRIILMVPLYSIYSFLSLFWYEYSAYFAIFRDCYEAYALYQFFALCIEYAGSWKNMEAAFVMRDKRPCLEPFCCCFVKPDADLLRWCQRGILQYTLIRPPITLACAILLGTGDYLEGEWVLESGWMWTLIVNNICVSVSLYFIVLFYQVSRQALKPYRPLLKFMVIKGIVFFCYWQSILLLMFANIPGVTFRDWTPNQIAVTLQNLFICLEMLFFAVLHFFAFPYQIYEIKAMSQAPLARKFELGGNIKKGLSDAISQKDLGKDTIDAFVPEKLKRTKKHKKSSRPTLNLVMVEEEDIVDIGVDGVEIPRTRPMDNKQVQLDESSDSVIDEEVDLDEIAHGLDHMGLKDDLQQKSDVTRR